jgi:chemotaxis protein histidine kinase CheA
MTPLPPSADFDPMLLDLFRVELENHTRVLENGLVSAESGQTAEKIEPLMRAAHSIKGAARIVGLSAAVSLAHAMEDVLSAAQQGKLTLTADHVDLLLKGNDAYMSMSRIETAAIPGWLTEREISLDQMARTLRDTMTGPVVSPSPRSGDTRRHHLPARWRIYRLPLHLPRGRRKRSRSGGQGPRKRWKEASSVS